MLLKRLFCLIFRRNHTCKSKLQSKAMGTAADDYLHGCDFWKHQLELVVDEKRYWMILYQVAMKEMAKRDQLPIFAPERSTLVRSDPATTEASDPSSSGLHNGSRHHQSSPTLSNIRTDFVPASTTLASINLPSSGPLAPSPSRKERVMCCDCSSCEREREISIETADALLNLSARTSRLQQEIAQLKLENCIKDQLISMLRRQSEESLDEITFSIPPLVSIPHHRPQLSLPTSPRKTLHS